MCVKDFQEFGNLGNLYKHTHTHTHTHNSPILYKKNTSGIFCRCK